MRFLFRECQDFRTRPEHIQRPSTEDFRGRSEYFQSRFEHFLASVPSCFAPPIPNRCRQIYCWFSHDVTKFQTSELLILQRFYFHDVLDQLKTIIQTNFHSEWVLGLVIDHA